jgi:hypothetical protein
MAREVPRTLRSLAPAYQRGIDADDYEVIVVDNGSPVPLDAALLDGFAGHLRRVRLDPAPPAPARAANLGIAEADADFVGLLIDGARLASPGLLAAALVGRRVADRPVVATLGWHLGPVRHMDAAGAGYDRAVEDALLDTLDWERDGYRLFSASTLAGSSARGWFAPMGESNGLFMPKAMWNELGGLDEAFALPGGGLSNHDLYRRACSLDGAELVVLLGEGTSTAARPRRAGSRGARCTRSTSRCAAATTSLRKTSRRTSGACPMPRSNRWRRRSALRRRLAKDRRAARASRSPGAARLRPRRSCRAR